MDPATVALAEAIARLSAAGLLALEVILLVLGVLVTGKSVAEERKRIADERALERAEWLRREGILIAERDTWRDRSLATDERLDRVAAAFARLSGKVAPD